HDGPITPDNPQVGFAFRRLAIFDLNERAMQPMHTPDGRYTLVFNGAIYNFKDLKSEISNLNPDHQWRTTGDSEVLLMSYATWGEKCVEHLNGMFAFAVWDGVEKSLFLARDRMGQKPLYATAMARSACAPTDVQMEIHEQQPFRAVAFASEVPGLQSVG